MKLLTIFLMLLFTHIAVANETKQEQSETFTLKIEPGFSIPLTNPQSNLYNIGGSETIKGLWNINNYLGIGPSATYLALPSESNTPAGTAWAFGGGVRVKRPHNLNSISPWVDADALYVRTESLNKPGFSLGVGVAVPVDKNNTFWLGPFMRYMQILDGSRIDYDTRDAKILSLGISLEIGTRQMVTKSEPPVVEPTVVCPKCPEDVKPIIPCPVVVANVNIKTKVFFAWDSFVIRSSEKDKLNTIVNTLKDAPSLNLEINGHASSEGTLTHNQTLSEKRATAVETYLITHGISQERLVTKGFGSSTPASSNVTITGRSDNRRVEFVTQGSK